MAAELDIEPDALGRQVARVRLDGAAPMVAGSYADAAFVLRVPLAGGLLSISGSEDEIDGLLNGLLATFHQTRWRQARETDALHEGVGA